MPKVGLRVTRTPRFEGDKAEFRVGLVNQLVVNQVTSDEFYLFWII
jgi:hypothetical protein